MEDGKAVVEGRAADGKDKGGEVEEKMVEEERPEGKTEARGKAEGKAKGKDVASVGRQTIGRESAQGRERPKEEEKGEKGGRTSDGRIICDICKGVGHLARLCPSKGWLGEVAPDELAEGEEQWPEEGDNLGAGEEDWTMELGLFLDEPKELNTRGKVAAPVEIRNRFQGLTEPDEEETTQVSGRRWRKGTVYAPPGLEIEDLTLGEFAEARDGSDEFTLNAMSEQEASKKGLVKVSAVVDTGAEEHALPEDVAAWIPLESSPASRAGKGVQRGWRRQDPSEGPKSDDRQDG